MCNLKATVIPVTTEATGTLSKSLRQQPSNIPGKHDVQKLHKTAIPGTAHTHTAGSTDVKYTTFNMANSITCAIHCNNRIAATVYSVATWFVSGM